MFEAAVDCFGGAIGGVGAIEVRHGVPGSAFERSAPRDKLAQALGTRVEVSVLISACIRALPRILLGSR